MKKKKIVMFTTAQDKNIITIEKKAANKELQKILFVIFL